MYRLTSKLIIYRGIEHGEILYRLSDICRRFYNGDFEREGLTSEIFAQINKLLNIGTKYGFDKNLWHNYLAFLIAAAENPFTLVSEKVGANDGSINAFAKNDFKIFKELFNYDFSDIENGLGIDCFSILGNYKAVVKKSHIFNESVSQKVRELSGLIENAENADEMYDIVTWFYKKYGVGKFGLNKAFRVSYKENRAELVPITSTGDVVLNDLTGYEDQKKRLIENTRAFVRGGKANNVLLYGDAGTGKSTSVKAVLNEFYMDGLRMIEIYKHEFKFLSEIISEIKNRNYRFIIFMDDLSFEEFETEYKYLKAVIEGGLETRPDNILIYATSNRRHLIKETWGDRSDRSDDEIHRSDTVQEKLSLSDRFGVTIGYFRPSREEYYNIVKAIAAKHSRIKLEEGELLNEADKWEKRHGGISGRTAQQFINYISDMFDDN
ncbi:ATP-binding protein [Anaerotignum faecicola]|nr:ATP-binding protein [Anaerotignum faecicola]